MHYLCSPYSNPNPSVKEHRYREALRCLAWFTNRGDVLFSPIVHSYPMEIHHTLPGDWQFWQKVDRDFISCATELWILTIDGWRESVGIAAEIEIAEGYGCPVSYVEPQADGSYLVVSN